MLLVVVFFVFIGFNGWGQITNDYQSSGATIVNLDVSTNWETWDGSAWVAATAAPIGVVSSGNTITILQMRLMPEVQQMLRFQQESLFYFKVYLKIL